MSKLEKAFELVELAGIYVDDGAPATAADRLRKAADLLDVIAVERLALLGIVAPRPEFKSTRASA
ncbi:hypothetical protein KZZ08_00675 [Roseovarius mucosus]|uniref:hypothetical protein n=1 Tax=Roseovarius mucosus TaxID=215743 RepID=UPI001C5DDE01|nr:hypothetical protein [Roseovarius mucosus]MBW4972110.1 hypothetical protein [Roseovarius mucosus]